LGEKLAPLLAKLDRSARDALVAQATATLLQVVEDAAYRMQIWVSGLNSENAWVGKIYNMSDEALDRFKKCEIASRMSSIMSREDIITLLIAPRDTEAPGGCVSLQAAQSPIDRAAVTCIAVNITCGFLEHEVAAVQEAAIDAIRGQSTKKTWALRFNLSSGPAQFLMQRMVDHFFEQATAKVGLLTPALRDDQERVVAQLLACTSSGRTIPDLGQAMERARAMRLNEQLDEQGLIEAIRNGESRMATAMLAVAADLPSSSVDRAASLRSAKGLVSIVWKAGFSMRVAVPLQMSLARLSPTTILHPNPGGGFPLAVDEMRWQVDFFAGNWH